MAHALFTRMFQAESWLLVYMVWLVTNDGLYASLAYPLSQTGKQGRSGAHAHTQGRAEGAQRSLQQAAGT